MEVLVQEVDTIQISDTQISETPERCVEMIVTDPYGFDIVFQYCTILQILSYCTLRWHERSKRDGSINPFENPRKTLYKCLSDLLPYDEFRCYYGYHLVIGSTPHKGECIAFDTPQRDIVKILIRNNLHIWPETVPVPPREDILSAVRELSESDSIWIRLHSSLECSPLL